jgi:glyoxylase-like metal-dependent hydrolase (beta-lactamase superfamily II)
MTAQVVRATLGVALLATGANAAAQATQTGDAQVEYQAIRPGLGLMHGAGGNVVLWSGPDGSVVIDTGDEVSAPHLLAAIATESSGLLRVAIDSHWHPEHTGGNAALAKAGALVIAQENAAARLAVRQAAPALGLDVPAAPRLARPVVTFDDTLTLHLNGERLVLEHVPAAHTDGDLVAWWTEGNIVYVGGIYATDEYPLVDVASGGSLAGLVAAVETVLSRADARTVVVPGKGALSNRAALSAYRDMLVAVGRGVHDLIEQGKDLEGVVAARPTAAFDERYGRGAIDGERFLRVLYDDLSRPR